MRWNCMSKALRFLQLTVKYQDCPFFTVFLTIKISSQNISITLLQISLKFREHRGRYWRKKLPWTILEEQFPVPRYTAASKIGNSVISLLWKRWCCCNPDYNKFSSLSSTTVVAIFFCGNILHCFKRHHCETLWRSNITVLHFFFFTFSVVVVDLPTDCILSFLFPAEIYVLVPVFSRSTDVVVVNFVVVHKFSIIDNHRQK